MDIPVFFVDQLFADGLLTLNEETSRHVIQVLRMKQQEKLQLTDGEGNVVIAQIVDEHKKRCTVRVTERNTVPKNEREICVAISLLKNSSRFEWFLEKATELGVTEIIPLICERTEKQHYRSARMKQITVSAMMQSKQAWLPVLHEPMEVSSIIVKSNYTSKLMAHCLPESKESIVDYRNSPSVQILIGPEGDFTKQEISFAMDQSFKPVMLGDTRLRTETAGIASATILCL